MIRIGLLGIVAAMMALLMKKEKQEYSMSLIIVTCLLIFLFALSQIEIVVTFVSNILGKLSLGETYLKVILKMLGISYVAEFSSAVCVDAGYQALAGQLELFAKLTILALSIPCFSCVMQLLEQFLS